MSPAGPAINDEIFEDAFTGTIDPFALFANWLEVARASEINDGNAMALATADTDGLPDVRMVLLNGFDARGFVFFTNFGSAKGQQLLVNPKAALLFHWKSLRRQVRVRGTVEQVSTDEADAYFATRPLQSRIGAHVSEQSRPLESRAAMVEKNEHLTQQFGDGAVPRPDYWSGFRIVPQRIEFWRDGAFRLHDRVELLRDGDGWSRARLYP